MAESKKCSRCGAELPSGAPGGHCPQCLLEFALTPPGGTGESDTEMSAAPLTEVPANDKPGDRIGRYKLLQQIGEGGMGAVWMAEQREPVRRKVALKIVKLGMDTKQVVARFEAERQALALMDHPNIAKVLDAGVTETGRPYFVMELVEGIKITDYCDQHRLSVAARLKLFIQVCRAVQHAHQKGIIHRDLKPSNILVIEQDGDPAPKVIDFGIAKATTGQQLTDKTLFTAFEQFLGTPAYMSPEQASLGRLDIDTRSDIYSLGVLIYELLAGRPPFDSAELQRSALDQILQTIREKDPPRPSTRLTTLTAQELSAVALCRQSEPRKLPHLLHGDLDWIVMKALEKDRNHRYETANGLARDVERHLVNEPVEARPPNKLRQLQKMIRRHRAVFSAALAVFVALLFGLVVSAWSLRQEKEAHRATKDALATEANLRQRAEARVKIEKADLLVQSGDYDEAEKLVDEIPSAMTEADNEHADVRRRLGIWHASKNQWRQAARNFTVLVQVNGLDDPQLSSSDCLLLGPALIESGDTNGYEAFRRAALARFITATNPVIIGRICRSSLLLPATPSLVGQLSRLCDSAACAQSADSCGAQDAWVFNSLALVEYRQGNYAKAVEWCEQSLPRGDGQSGPQQPFAQLVLAMSHYRLHRQEEAAFELAYGRESLTNRHEVFRNIEDPAANPPKNPNEALDWLGDRILLREAIALIGEQPSSAGAAQREAVEKFDGATKRMIEHDLDGAQKLISEVPARSLQMEGGFAGVEIYHLGWLQAYRGLWQQGISNWNLVALGPEGKGGLRAGRWLSGQYLRHAPVLIEKGDASDYEKLRQSAIAIFGETGDPIEAESVLLICLLQPAGSDTIKPLRRLAGTFTNKGIADGGDSLGLQTDSVTGRPGEDWSSRAPITLALLAYRVGDYAKATYWLAQSATNSCDCESIDARRQIIASMNDYQLKRQTAAQSELANCREAIETGYKKGKIPNMVRDETGTWFDWWIDHILLQEAEAMIEPAPKTPDPAK